MKNIASTQKESWLIPLIFTASLFTFSFQEFFQNRSPNWDEASYLLEGASIRASFRESLWVGLVGMLATNGSGRPPFLSWIAAALVHESESFQFTLSIAKIAIWIVWLVSLNFLYKVCLTNDARSFALVVASFSNLAISIGQQFLTDLLVVSFVQLSIYFLIIFFKRGSNKFLYWSAFFLAIGSLTKPTALILSAPVIAYLIWLSSRGRQWLETALRFAKFALCSFGIVLPWLILNWENLVGYGNKQISFPRYLYIYAPDNARSLTGILEFITLLLRSSGIVFWTGLTLTIYSFLFFLLGKGRRVHSEPLESDEGVKVNSVFVATLLIIPAFYFEWILLWEARYSLIFITGVSMLLGLLWQEVPRQTSWSKSGPALLLFVSIITQHVSNDPSKWSQPLKQFFYSSEYRSVLSNFGINLIDYGRIPVVKEDIAIAAARIMSERLNANDRIGLGVSHPELNNLTLSWAQKSLGLPNNQFLYLTHKTFGPDGFMEDSDNLIKERLYCSDYAILPIENKLPSINWPDIVDFQNRNVFDLNNSRQFFESNPLLTFSASIPLGVASNQRQSYGLFKQKEKYKEQRVNCTNFADSFLEQVNRN
jgi:hypothetical protein